LLKEPRRACSGINLPDIEKAIVGGAEGREILGIRGPCHGFHTKGMLADGDERNIG